MDFTLKLSSNALTSPKATPSLLKTEFNWINPIIVVGRKANYFLSVVNIGVTSITTAVLSGV